MAEIIKDNLEDWKKAGKITAEALEYGASLIMPGASYAEVTEKIEKKIKELGGGFAFPPQISLNETAAHFTTAPGEDIIFNDQLCSLDIGVEVRGAVGDSAVTIDLSGKYGELVEASEKALEEAMKIISPGVALGEIGRKIQETIESYGFSPVRNLSGHGLGIYEIHSSPSIPNFDTGSGIRLEKGQAIAVEPFASTGAGEIYESSPCSIFTLKAMKPVRSPVTRQVLKIIEGYKGLPFTTRWLCEKFSLGQVKFAIREMLQQDMLEEHPPLLDKNKGFVSQAEHTVIVDDPIFITTRRER